MLKENVVDSLSDHSKPSDHVRVQTVWKAFPHSSAGFLMALSGVDLTLERGEFVSIIGPSGCGKSTLLAVIGGLERATVGSVEIGGLPVKKPYTDAGVVFQQDLLLEWRTCLQNILLQFELRGESPKPHREEALTLLELVGIKHFADSYPRELSGGMRQRVALCRALVHDPKLLLMDEPFGALDALTREQLTVDLARICEVSAKTVIFITHSIAEAVFLADRVAIMSPRPGHIVEEVTIDLSRPRTEEVRRSDAYADYIRRVRDIFEREGVL